MRTVSLELMVDDKRIIMDAASTSTPKGVIVQAVATVDGKKVLATVTLSPELDLSQLVEA